MCNIAALFRRTRRFPSRAVRADLWRLRLWSRVVALPLCCLCALSTAGANELKIADLVVDLFSLKPIIDPNSGKQLGAEGNFIVHYDLLPSFATQKCCDAGGLRWIQLLDITPPLDKLSPMPNRPFIDPRPGQFTGPGLPVGDNNPFFDITYANLDDLNAGDTAPNGSGQYAQDRPQIPLTAGLNFNAELLLVCQQAGMTYGILGGFTWGLQVKGNQAVPIPATPLTIQDQANAAAKFNQALAIDFPGWMIETSEAAWPPPMPTIYASTPEPGTVYLMLGAGVVAIAVRVFRHRFSQI